MPSIASRPLTCSRIPSMPSTRTRCSPIGLGRLAERVLKTPCSGRFSVAAWMHRQDAAIRLMQPGQHDEISHPLAIPFRPAWTSESKIR